jgi:hypothetical protein
MRMLMNKIHRSGRFAWRTLGLVVCLLIAFGAAGCGKGKLLDLNQGSGTLTISTEPQGAVIIFDGSNRGWAYVQKPIILKGVSYGWHSIKAVLPGYVPRIDEMNFGSSLAAVRMALSKNTFGRLTIFVDPSGAEVFVDSRFYGAASPTKEINGLAFGGHTVWVRKKGFRPERKSIVVERQTHRAYHLKLRPER